VLNGSADGRQLFSGRSVATPPIVAPSSTAYGPSPLAVAGAVVNTAPASNYIANGAATAFGTLVATLTPGAAPYDGVANTYPYLGDTAAFTNTPPTGGAVSTAVAPNTDLGYTVRGDNSAITAIQQGLYAIATAQLPSGASTATQQSFTTLIDAASFRIEQGLKGPAASAPANLPTAPAPATGLIGLIGGFGATAAGLQTLAAQQAGTALALTQATAAASTVDQAAAIVDLKAQENQLTLVYKVEAERRGLTLDKFL
jgi:hypothetical protein